MANKAISISNLKFKYKGSENYALDDISLDIHEGEFFCIMGPTGAGKTTLCTCLNGLIPNSISGTLEGKVEIFGKDTQAHPIFEIAPFIGITFQDPESQMFGMSVEEDLAFGPENICMPRDEIEKRIKWVSQVVNLKKYLHRLPWTLSGGQKQRVAISAGLTFLPKIMVFDEPVAELDPIGKNQVFEVIHELNKNHNITIVLVEHNAEEIADHADRIAIINKGKLEYLGTPKEVFWHSKEISKLGLQIPQVTELQTQIVGESQKNDQPIVISLSEAKSWLEKKISLKISHTAQLLNSEKKKAGSIIEVENLHQNYKGEVSALNGINLTIYEGDLIAIVGQNGCGKTTLVKHFNGLLKPTQGNVIINGKNSKEMTAAELSQTVGYTFQNPDHQIFANTVYEEVAFGLENLGFPLEEIQERVDVALDSIGLFANKNDDPFSLGKGNRQKIALASSIAMNPKVLIVDEPTTGLDYAGCVDVMHIIRKLHQKGHTIVVITHEMWLVAQYANRVIVMHDGKILIDAPPREVFKEKEIIQKAYLTPPQITRLGQDLFDNNDLVFLSVQEFLQKTQISA